VGKMDNGNVIIITMDAVRPDHLGCYGYKKIKTPNIDEISKNGVTFENCITVSCLTPVSIASIFTGTYPNKHSVRNPFGFVNSTTLTQILKEKNYKTAGFVGISFLSSRHNFNMGFDSFNEPTEKNYWHKVRYSNPKDGSEIDTFWGNWWVDNLLEWIERNHNNKFFVWGHYFECHVPAHRWLLNKGLIKEGELSEWDYYDAEIQCMDKNLFGPLINMLKKHDLWDDITLVVMSDHGETFDEHSHKRSWRQHQSLYNTDLKIPLIIKNKKLGSGIRIKDMVRSIDVLPTILSILDIDVNLKIDGVDLLPIMKNEEYQVNTAYSEELYELRGYGILQAVQDGRFKLIRNNTLQEEEFYDIENDPEEKRNIISSGDSKIAEFRKIINGMLKKTGNTINFTEKDKKEIESKLQILGYID